MPVWVFLQSAIRLSLGRLKGIGGRPKRLRSSSLTGAARLTCCSVRLRTVARIAGVPQSRCCAATPSDGEVLGPSACVCASWGLTVRLGVCYSFCSTMRRKILCQATTRRGTPCQCKAIKTKHGAWRCRLHGGLSTGPTTPEGRERIAAAVSRRWAAHRAARSAGSPLAASAAPQ